MSLPLSPAGGWWLHSAWWSGRCSHCVRCLHHQRWLVHVPAPYHKWCIIVLRCALVYPCICSTCVCVSVVCAVSGGRTVSGGCTVYIVCARALGLCVWELWRCPLCVLWICCVLTRVVVKGLYAVCLAVKHFSEAFLLTYYTFITPDELTTRLLKR